MIEAVERTTWDLIGQLGVWLVGFPLLIGGLVTYIALQIAAERRENQRTAGRWGIAAKSKSDPEH